VSILVISLETQIPQETLSIEYNRQKKNNPQKSTSGNDDQGPSDNGDHNYFVIN
jgi:hypothetical protein